MASAKQKNDMQRLGIFQEMSYISIGDKYSSHTNRPFNTSAYQGRQIQTGVPKRSCALQGGFFDNSYKRLFEKEALSDRLKLARQNQLQMSKRNLGKAFLPSGGATKLCGSGSYYGTLSGPVEAMSPLTLPRKPRQLPGRNIVTSPSKKGSGYSYPNVTLSKMELYAADPYDRAREILKKEAADDHLKVKGEPFKINHSEGYFQKNPFHSDKNSSASQKSHSNPLPKVEKVSPVPFKPSTPGKRAGGMKAGAFDPYPSYSSNPYTLRGPKENTPVFHPAPGPKSTPVKSIISTNVIRRAKSGNFSSTLML